MADPQPTRRLRKELTLFGVFAIATGTTLSSGFFVLPGLAAKEAGPAVILSYGLAAVLMVPAMLSILELATAMPRAGGPYYFLDRSLGPLAGTVGGLGTWAALVLKSAFALYGMGAYVSLVVPLFGDSHIVVLAISFALFFGAINLIGTREAGRFQVILVAGLLAILAWFIGRGGFEVRRESFEGFFDAGTESIVGTAGLVFLGYGSLAKIASVSEEVRDPERNLPRGTILALGMSVLVYVLGVSVMVGILGTATLSETLTPVVLAADVFAGPVGVIAVSVAAILSFSSVANAGILSASRYPLAMARDHLVPSRFRRIGGRGTPLYAIFFTVGAIVAVLLVFREPMSIAKLASAFQLLMFGLLCLAVIVMRESGIESYDPGFRSPLYPWTQILGMLAPFLIIAEMGGLAVLFSAGLVGAGLGWYFFYARDRVARHGAIYHVFERLGRQRYARLDRELRSILKEKGLRQQDPFEEIVTRAAVLDADLGESFDRIVERAAARLAQDLPIDAGSLSQGFLEGTRTGATPVTHGVALPHMRLPGVGEPHMVIVHCPNGVTVAAGPGYEDVASSGRTFAIFFLVSPTRDPAQHLRLLAELAGRVDQDGFIPAWRAARDHQTLKEILVRDDRFVTLEAAPGTAAGAWIGRPLRELTIPGGCLVVVIRRDGETVIPSGSTVVRDGDRLTMIGSAPGIRALRSEHA